MISVSAQLDRNECSFTKKKKAMEHNVILNAKMRWICCIHGVFMYCNKGGNGVTSAVMCDDIRDSGIGEDGGMEMVIVTVIVIVIVMVMNGGSDVGRGGWGVGRASTMRGSRDPQRLTGSGTVHGRRCGSHRFTAAAPRATVAAEYG